MSTDLVPDPAFLPPVAESAAPAIVAKRRGRPLGSKNKSASPAAASATPAKQPGKSKPVKQPKPVAAGGGLAAELAVLQALAEDGLAVAVHGAGPMVRSVVAALLKAGV